MKKIGKNFRSGHKVCSGPRDQLEEVSTLLIFPCDCLFYVSLILLLLKSFQEQISICHANIVN